jgi:hypothetical protein
MGCSDPHCPKCQSFARFKWLEDRQAELLTITASADNICPFLGRRDDVFETDIERTAGDQIWIGKYWRQLLGEDDLGKKEQ